MATTSHLPSFHYARLSTSSGDPAAQYQHVLACAPRLQMLHMLSGRSRGSDDLLTNELARFPPLPFSVPSLLSFPSVPSLSLKQSVSQLSKLDYKKVEPDLTCKN